MLLKLQGFKRLGTAFVSAVWSKKMPLAHVRGHFVFVGLSAWLRPWVLCGLVQVWLLRRYLACNPLETHRLYCLLGLVAGGGPGHGPMHFLVESAGVLLGFTCDTLNFGWTRPGLPMLHQLAGPYQHFKAAIWEAWRAKVSFDLCRRQGFWEGPMLDIAGSLQLLHSPHVR